MLHNVLWCNFTLSKWYGTDPRCKIEGYHIESMVHLLNSYKEFKKNYSAGHNKILEKLFFELTGLRRAVFLDKTAKMSFEELTLNLPAELECLRLDLVLCGKNMVIIADVACPYELYTDVIYKSKKEKHADLLNFASKTCNCVFPPIIIGSSGFVHNKTLNNLMRPRLSKRRGKGLCKYFINSDIPFARNIWNKRCSLVHDR